MMNIRCVWEHNGGDTLLYAVDFPGAFTREESLEAAREKMAQEIRCYAAWRPLDGVASGEVEIIQDAACRLQVRDADPSGYKDHRNRPPLGKSHRFPGGFAC